jgi:ribosomal protein S18 acetylase RimI-like enzyme
VTDPLDDFSERALIRSVEEHARFNAVDWAGLPGVFVRDTPEMVLFVTGLPVSWANGVEAARLRPQLVDRRIDEAIAAFRAAGVSAAWSVGPLSRPRDLGDRLLARGFELDQDLAWMAADLERPRRIEQPTNLVIERVTTQAHHEGWLDVMDRGFGHDPESHITLDTLGRHDRNRQRGPWVRFVGFLNARPVASSGLIVGGGVAGIYNVATVPRARRRGFGTAMTLTAMRHARRLGHRVAVLATSPLGRGVYEGLGFRDVCTSRTYVWEPGAGILSPHAESPGDRDGR